MSDHLQQYRLSDEQSQKRLQELASRDVESIADTSMELALARFLAEKCALSNPALCNSILATIGKLAIAAQRYAIASNELLSRPALLGFVQEIIAAVCQEVQQLPNSEVIIENIAKRLDAAMTKVKNESDETPMLLSYERDIK